MSSFKVDLTRSPFFRAGLATLASERSLDPSDKSLEIWSFATPHIRSLKRLPTEITKPTTDIPVYKPTAQGEGYGSSLFRQLSGSIVLSHRDLDQGPKQFPVKELKLVSAIKPKGIKKGVKKTQKPAFNQRVIYFLTDGSIVKGKLLGPDPQPRIREEMEYKKTKIDSYQFI